MEKLSSIFSGEEFASDFKKALSKKGLEIEDSKLKDLISLAKNQMDLENVSGGSLEGIIKGMGMLSGALLGGVTLGKIIPKATGIKVGEGDSSATATATATVGRESLVGMGIGVYMGYEVADTIIKFLNKKGILSEQKGNIIN